MCSLTHTGFVGFVRVVLASRRGVPTKKRKATGKAPAAKATKKRKTSNSGKRAMASGKTPREKAARLSAPVSKPTVQDQLQELRCVVVSVRCFAYAVTYCALTNFCVLCMLEERRWDSASLTCRTR